MQEYTFKKSTCERYDLRWGKYCGWAIITIDENGGVFNCQSDYDNYSYCWPNHGRESFKHFLCEINTHYLLNKVSKQDNFDYDRSLKDWKQQIIQTRKERECSKEQARDMWDFINDFDGSEPIALIQERLYDNDTISKIFEEPWYVFETYMDYSPQALAFANELWPMFIDILKKEIDYK